MITHYGWKLCLSDFDKCQLYNLREDPHETTNLFYWKRHPEVITRLTGEIHRWQAATGDRLRVG